MVQKSKARVSAPPKPFDSDIGMVNTPDVLMIPVNTLPTSMFKIEKVGRHFKGYVWQGSPNPNEPGRWRSLFPAATILTSVLGALEREISDAAIAL